MTAKQSKRARLEAARRAKRRAKRRERMLRAMAALAVVVGVGAFIGFRGGSPDQAVALAPDFQLTSSNGDAVKLSDYRGQPVAVTFMHTY